MPGGSRPVGFKGPAGFTPLNTSHCAYTVYPGIHKASSNIWGKRVLPSVGLNIEKESC